jgi:hypothetical protein
MVLKCAGIVDLAAKKIEALIVFKATHTEVASNVKSAAPRKRLEIRMTVSSDVRILFSGIVIINICRTKKW